MPEKQSLILPPVLTVKQLAEHLNQPVTAVIAKLMGFGVLATINEDIDFDTAAIIADDFGFVAEREEAPGHEEISITGNAADLSKLIKADLARYAQLAKSANIKAE